MIFHKHFSFQASGIKQKHCNYKMWFTVSFFANYPQAIIVISRQKIATHTNLVLLPIQLHKTSLLPIQIPKTDQWLRSEVSVRYKP